jgi:hypothetical protein
VARSQRAGRQLPPLVRSARMAPTQSARRGNGLGFLPWPTIVGEQPLSKLGRYDRSLPVIACRRSGFAALKLRWANYRTRPDAEIRWSRKQTLKPVQAAVQMKATSCDVIALRARWV